MRELIYTPDWEIAPEMQKFGDGMGMSGRKLVEITISGDGMQATMRFIPSRMTALTCTQVWV
ncbi:MAG: hypothetical protein ACD_25C00072G0001 [uncultured bacterium]|nr:MAG: hypothetical protein ACD_25C00072G0001 [uncultured bacterium]